MLAYKSNVFFVYEYDKEKRPKNGRFIKSIFCKYYSKEIFTRLLAGSRTSSAV